MSDMTRKEQINGLYELKQYLMDNPIELNGYISLPITLIDYAIKALEQEPRKGHWIETAEEYYKAINEKGGGVNENTDYFVDDIACSECLTKFSVIDNEAERFGFCPCCGSDNK